MKEKPRFGEAPGVCMSDCSIIAGQENYLKLLNVVFNILNSSLGSFFLFMQCIYYHNWEKSNSGITSYLVFFSHLTFNYLFIKECNYRPEIKRISSIKAITARTKAT